MNIALPQAAAARTHDSSLEDALRRHVKGDVRFDALSRTIYSTDASIYEIIPLGVVLPRDREDVIAVVRECRAAGAALIARGGGTGLTGGAVGAGVQLDLSRYMNRIGPCNADARLVEVEPGVVLDELNQRLAPHGLHFAPDVATSSRATLGGMIANNSCGAHSILYGRTVDHVDRLTVVLSDGEVVSFARDVSRVSREEGKHRQRANEIENGLAAIRDENFAEIQRRFPKVLRSNGGYGLDRLGPPGTRADAAKVLCGSEGTLGVVVSARLRLTPLPCRRGLVVLHFHELFAALGAAPWILLHKPAAVELLDRMIVDAGRANPAIRQRCGFLQGDPSALLVVEFFADSDDQLRGKLESFVADRDACGAASSIAQAVEPSRQADVWSLRKAGLGLLMSKPGDAQPYAFIEDAAVDPARLCEYIGGVREILAREGVHAGYYAHASVGCLHVKPVLNLKDGADVERMRRIAEAVCELAIAQGGAMTGEHGDGIVRSCWIEKVYGPNLVEAFRRVKRLFDPDGILNPHKIVDPWPMTDHLRYGASYRTRDVKTGLDFTVEGGMAGLAGMCSGVGQCRQRLVGTMCPSYMATGDERHTTRARANALRVALSNKGVLDGLNDPHLHEVMDLCLSCKACKTECPTGVDMARLKTEWLFHCHLTTGVDRRSRFIAEMPRFISQAGRFPRFANLFTQRSWIRRLVEKRYGMDRRMPPPRFAPRTFRRWWRRHCRTRNQRNGERGRVVYFVDTWTNYFTPEVGAAAVTLLERAGFEVLCPPTVCCGRPAIGKGLLAEARQLAESNVRALAHAFAVGVPIIGTEPSCILTFTDEYPRLVPSAWARRLAERAMMVETFLARLLEDDPRALCFRGGGMRLLYHAHCHQKALVGSRDAVTLLRHAFGAGAAEIPSGCCGMAGSFGHEVEHYDVARAIGEDRLFPAVRNRGEAGIAVSGFSCRHQIEHHTALRPKHLVEYLAEALE